jgi:hypothetical protein
MRAFRFAPGAALQPPSRRVLLVLYLVAGLLAGAISLALRQSMNFEVFVAAARALWRSEDLYVLRARDYFKYSPTFALVFSPIAWLPPAIGAPAWSLVNFGAAYAGIDRAVPADDEKRLALTVALVGIALGTDADQTNLLIAGAILLAFDAYERGRAGLGSWLVIGAAFIKVFPLLGAALALLRRGAARKLSGMGLAAAILGASPLLACRPRVLWEEYRSWLALLAWDRRAHGWSLMSAVRDGLSLPLGDTAIQLAGAVLLATPLALGARLGSDRAWRRTAACALLSFFVLFNHRAEYASFVLPAVGLGVWLATSGRSRAKTALVALALVAPGPFFVRPDASVTGALAILGAHRCFHPLRVVPLFAVWLWMLADLMQRFLEVRIVWRPGRDRSEAHAP